MSWWESRVRRILLVAHVLPAIFGLVAVLGADDSRPLDRVVWVLVIAWTLALLALGWRGVPRGPSLVAWILSDALVMAGLMFIGTSARTVATFVAVDGALFAAVFVSAPVALAQVSIAYSGLIFAEMALARGWDAPTAPQGWQTPLLVTLAGILALRFLRSALDRLLVALEGRALAIAAEREALAEAAQEEALARDVSGLEDELAPALLELETMARQYDALVCQTAASEEARWLIDSATLARTELASLQNVLAQNGEEELGDLIDTAILGASAARLADHAVSRSIDPELIDLILPGPTARAIAGFVREAVTNALTHGGTPVGVRVESRVQGLRVAVSDGGRGFPRQEVADGFGSEAMERHARDAGGRIEQTPFAPGRPHEIALVLQDPP